MFGYGIPAISDRFHHYFILKWLNAPSIIRTFDLDSFIPAFMFRIGTFCSLPDHFLYSVAIFSDDWFQLSLPSFLKQCAHTLLLTSRRATILDWLVVNLITSTYNARESYLCDITKAIILCSRYTLSWGLWYILNHMLLTDVWSIWHIRCNDLSWLIFKAWHQSVWVPRSYMRALSFLFVWSEAMILSRSCRV